jgi:SAM-dependent methyltransferase
MEQIKVFYDLTATETAEKWYPNDLLLPTIKEFIALFKTKPSILDLGCGTGHESMRLHNEGAEVVGIDLSPLSIEIAKARNPDSTFFTMDFFSLDDSLGLFDGIFASGSIIHVSPGKFPGLLETLSCMIKDDGYFEVILQIGKGEKVVETKFRENVVKRIIYLYDLPGMQPLFAKYHFHYLKTGTLNSSLRQGGWEAYIFQKV